MRQINHFFKKDFALVIILFVYYYEEMRVVGKSRGRVMKSYSKCYGCAFFFVLILAVQAAFAQRTELKSRLFKNANERLQVLKQKHAEFLSPTHYSNAVEKLTRAMRDFELGRDIDRIRRDLQEVKLQISQAEQAVDLRRSISRAPLAARDAALLARAHEFAADAFEKAELILKELGYALEKGDLMGARKRAFQEQRAYQEAELIAIKLHVISPARELIRRAEKMGCATKAPATYRKAASLLAVAEEILENDRSAIDEASEKARQAAYEARHAMRLAIEARLIESDRRTLEDEILYFEEHLALIARALGLKARFDSTLQVPVKEILSGIKNLKEEKRSLIEDLNEKDREIAELRRSLSETVAKLDELQEKESNLEEQLTEQKKLLDENYLRQVKFRKVQSLFKPSEATVLLDDDRLIIHLFGISFPVGSYRIPPRCFSLLSKVERALREYPDAKVTIEGHTDSVGDERYNLRLSTQRALAVRSYLANSMNVPPERFEAVGFGESAPIASNATPAGRAQNRRITLIIETK